MLEANDHELNHRDGRMTVSYPPEISSEDDLQAYIAEGMDQNGWTTIREAKTAFDDYRADIIGYRDDIGAVGIECKYVTGGPVVVAEAARQIINKYAGQKFLKWRVDMWGVCLYGRAFRPSTAKAGDTGQRCDYEQIATSKRILNGLGIGFATAHDSRVMLEFLPTGSDVKIPLFHAEREITDRYSEDFDRQRVLELIKNRRPQ